MHVKTENGLATSPLNTYFARIKNNFDDNKQLEYLLICRQSKFDSIFKLGMQPGSTDSYFIDKNTQL